MSDRDPQQHVQLDLFCIALTFQPTFILPEQKNTKQKINTKKKRAKAEPCGTPELRLEHFWKE